MSIPKKITAGTTLDLPITLTAYPAPTWQVSIWLQGPQPIHLPADASGSAHRVVVSAETTAAWKPGRYWYILRVTDGSDVVEVERGQVTIAQDLAQVEGEFDGRGHIERVLESIEAVIEGRASKDQERYRINNRELYRTPIADLLKLRSTYRNELFRERQAAKGSSLLGRQVKVRF